MKIIKRFLPFILALTIVFGSCITASAAESDVFDAINMNDMPHSDYQYYIGWYLESTGEYYYLFTLDKMQVVVSDSSYTFKTPTNLYGNLFVRRPSDGMWGQNGYCDVYKDRIGWTISKGTPVTTNYEVIEITTGKVVFPTPPTLIMPTIQRVEELPKIVENQATVITITAVFCLVLLMGLVMLRKKLPVFLRL